MRWQRLSLSECIRRREWRAAWSRFAPSLALTLCLLAGAAALLMPTPAPAEGEGDGEAVGGSEIFTMGEGPERGMSATNPRVKSLLSSHPNDFVTVCVAGCEGKPSIVQILPKPAEKRVGGMRTTSGGDPAPPQAAYDGIDRDAVLCVAGCDGASSQVVQRLPGLPPPQKAHPTAEQGNEPLDVH